MDEKLYQKLVDSLESKELDIYLQMDPFVISKMKEIMDFVIKYEFLPTRKLVFSCQKISMLDWIEEVREKEEPLFQVFNAFISQYKVRVYGENVWEYKYCEFYTFVEENKRKPRVFEQTFFDGTDMYKWYNTQRRRLICVDTNCAPLTKVQENKLESLERLLKEFSPIKELIPLTNGNKLKELYAYLLKNKSLLKLNQSRFSDGTNMFQFFKQVQNREIDLTTKEQFIFNKLLELEIRINKDGVKGILKYSHHSHPKKIIEFHSSCGPKLRESHFSKIPSLFAQRFLLNEMSIESYMAYFRTRMNLTTEKMADLLGMWISNYINIENGRCKLTYFRKMQFLILLERKNMEDATLLSMHDILNEFMHSIDEENYYIFKLCAMFSLDNKRNLAYSFYRKYRTVKDVLPKVKYSINKQIVIYQELEEISENESLLDDEKLVVLHLKTILKRNILSDKLDGEIVNKTNICLGLPVCSIHSIYGISTFMAEDLLKTYEAYKLKENITFEQIAYIDKCCELLMCVLNPGQSLEFEILRLINVLDIKYEELADLFGISRSHLSHCVNGIMTSFVYQSILSSLDKLDAFENHLAVERFKTCFLEAKKLDLKRN